MHVDRSAVDATGGTVENEVSGNVLFRISIPSQIDATGGGGHLGEKKKDKSGEKPGKRIHYEQYGKYGNYKQPLCRRRFVLPSFFATTVAGYLTRKEREFAQCSWSATNQSCKA